MQKVIYSMIDVNVLGKVEVHINGKKSLASGSIIFNADCCIIATAAHCIYDWETQKFNDDIYFLPYMQKFNKKYKVISAHVPKIWVQKAMIEYDTGFLVVEEAISKSMSLNNISLSPAFNIGYERIYDLYGFENRLIPSKSFFISSGKAIKDRKYASTMQGVFSKHTKSGVSGGPWITKLDGKFVINSVTSLSIKSIKSTLWGPYWGDIIRETYEVAIKQKSQSKDVESYYYVS